MLTLRPNTIIDIILFITQIARSILYNWIEKFSYLLDTKMSYILSKRTSKKLDQIEN
jgi:hypothetical protein